MSTAPTAVSSGPLTGLRVLEVAGIGPAPYGCMLLADLGADVVLVQRPDTDAVTEAAHAVLFRNRHRLVLDLKRPAGVAVLLDLAADADVLVEGFRPGVAERLGFGPVQCHARNPGLVYARMTGWGQEGPLASTAGHDINYLALSGALGAIGPAGAPPVPPLNLLGDFGAGGLMLAVGVLAAVLDARSSGMGQVVDAAIVDGTVSLLAMLSGMQASGLWNEERGTNLLDGGAPEYGVYECADGGYVAVGALEPQFFALLLDGLGLVHADVPDRRDPSCREGLRGLLAARFASRPRNHWVEVFAGTDACVTAVLSPREAAYDAHLTARGTWLTEGSVVQPAPAPRFSRTPSARPTAARTVTPGGDAPLTWYTVTRPDDGKGVDR
ncbi:CaiB/BaiF CoA transferase family protein [Pedococcus sp. 5OH_020]|uniref:CaiB/BaiF CoA transferase family protein n=1 Tax=Pedococcus sp. 5OH_020 TaxID=2989814 RepID=UPI0022E9AA73|nr:CaiB/BaiF CoA-transferase family protein [Pedococcus sp. 5OH_020]